MRRQKFSIQLYGLFENNIIIFKSDIYLNNICLKIYIYIPKKLYRTILVNNHAVN